VVRAGSTERGSGMRHGRAPSTCFPWDASFGSELVCEPTHGRTLRCLSWSTPSGVWRIRT